MKKLRAEKVPWGGGVLVRDAGERVVAGRSRGCSDAASNSGDGEVDADEAAVRAKRRARGRALLWGARLSCGLGMRGVSRQGRVGVA